MITRLLAIILSISISSFSYGSELIVRFEQILGGTAQLELHGSKVTGVGIVNINPNLVYMNDSQGNLTFFDVEKKQFSEGPKLNQRGMQWCLCVWAPDAKKIAYRFNDDLYIYDIAQHTTFRLSENHSVTSFAWRNNEELFFSKYEKSPRRGSSIHLIDVLKRSTLLLASSEDTFYVDDFVPSLNRLFYSRLRHGDMDDRTLYRADFVNGILKNQNIIIVSRSLQIGDLFVSVTQDGRYAAVSGIDPRQSSSRQSLYRSNDVYVIDMQSGNYIRILEPEVTWVSNGFVAINSDGTGVLVSSSFLDKHGIPNLKSLRYAKIDQKMFRNILEQR
jgi:hypothetical protein